jgi:aminomethyltransferase
MSHAGPEKTPLHAAHVALGARMVEFAGFEMPVQYSGVVDEHTAVRTAAGLFDVSHMGEFVFQGERALATLEAMVPTNVSRLSPGRALYTVLMNDAGGIVDDVIVYRVGAQDFMVVVNAANRAKDLAWCEAHLQPGCELRDVSHVFALLAVQGPRAAEILARASAIDLAALAPFDFAEGLVAGIQCIVSRTGYTGEDGFEVFCSGAATPALWDALLAEGAGVGVKPCGLGARDSLRTEMRFCLYGQDIDDTTTPLEAGLGWLVKLDKGDFIGRDVLVRQKADGLRRKLVGFEMIEPGIARHGHAIVDGGAKVGVVTSGTHSPTLGRAIGLGYVPADLARVGAEIAIDIRGKARRARVCKTPFYERRKLTG